MADDLDELGREDCERGISRDREVVLLKDCEEVLLDYYKGFSVNT